MKKISIIIISIILSANAFSQDMFWALKTELNMPFSTHLVNYSNYGSKSVSLNDFSYGFMVRKHIFANFHLVAGLENKHNNLELCFYDTEQLDSTLIVKTNSFQGGLGLEYVYYGTEFVKYFVAAHALYSNTYLTNQKIKIKIFTGTSTDGMGDEIKNYDYENIKTGHTMSDVLYKLNYTEIIPALEIGVRIKSSFFFEPSLVIKPSYNQFIMQEHSKLYFMFNLKFGDVF